MTDLGSENWTRPLEELGARRFRFCCSALSSRSAVAWQKRPHVAVRAEAARMQLRSMDFIVVLAAVQIEISNVMTTTR
jgi:hypothetical protein